MNLATLKADIADWTGHTFPNSRLASIIRMMEADLRREVRVQAMVTTDDLFPIYDRHEQVPEGFLQPVRFAIDHGDCELAYLSPQVFYAQPEYRQSGVPSIYTREGDQFVFAPQPGGGYDGLLSYYRAFQGLVADTDTHWLLINHYSIPLYFALAHAFSFVQDDAQSTKYGSLAMQLVNELNIKDQMATFPLNQVRRGVDRP